jgi:hypothetical protein
MTDKLTETDHATAKAQGWELCHVYDLASRKWLVSVVHVDGGAFKSAKEAQHFVVERAKTLDALAIKALTSIFSGTKKKAKTK